MKEKTKFEKKHKIIFTTMFMLAKSVVDNIYNYLKKQTKFLT